MVRWLASLLGVSSGGDPRRLLVLVFVAAALCTAVLNFDATVVLLDPGRRRHRGHVGPVGRALADALPSSTSLLALLGTATPAAVLATVVNNLPATLVLLAALAPGAPTGLVLAVLLGVNTGPNLTSVGPLATLLWRRVLVAQGQAPAVGTFTRLVLVTVPLTVVASVLALRVGLRVSGI